MSLAAIRGTTDLFVIIKDEGVLQDLDKAQTARRTYCLLFSSRPLSHDIAKENKIKIPTRPSYAKLYPMTPTRLPVALEKDQQESVLQTKINVQYETTV